VGAQLRGLRRRPLPGRRLGVAYIKGVQGEGVIPSVKHFAANNEEFERHRIDAQSTSARCTRSICPPSKPRSRRRRVDRDVGLQQGQRRALRREARRCSPTFCKRNSASRGLSSPTGAAPIRPRPRSTRAWIWRCRAARRCEAWLADRPNAGRGQRRGWLTADKVLAEVKAGNITEATLDDNVGRILRVIFVSGIFDHPHAGGGEVDTPAQQAVALAGRDRRHRAAEERRPCCRWMRRRFIRSP
jgi:beta-glucosidase